MQPFSSKEQNKTALKNIILWSHSKYKAYLLITGNNRLRKTRRLFVKTRSLLEKRRCLLDKTRRVLDWL